VKTKALLLIGGKWHPFSRCASVLKEFLEGTGAVSCAVTEDPAALAKLNSYDVVILYTQGGKLTGVQERSLCRFVRRGGGLLGIHCASDSFASNKEYRSLIGSRFSSHGPVTEFTVEVEGGNPVGARFGSFRVTDEFYLLKQVAKGVTVHAVAPWQGRKHPMVYTQDYGKGKVFYTALGHDERTFRRPEFKRLIWRGLRYVAGRIKKEPIRAVVVGYGPAFDMGKLHAETIRGIEGFDLLGVCDADPSRLEAAQEELGLIRTYESAREVARDKDADLAVIVTPHDTHAKLALTLLRAGKHVVCEKPLALSTKECEQLLGTAKRKKVMLSTFHNRRWDGDFRAVKKILEEGTIGEVFHVEIGMGGFSHPGHWWRSEKKISGGVFFDWGAHLVDWTLNLIPERVSQVTGFLQKRVWHDVTIDDWSSVVLRFKDGRSAMIELGHITGVSRPKWRILGSKGAIWGDWGLENLSVVTYREGKLFSEKVPVEESLWDAYWRDVADHLLTGSPLEVTGEAASRVVAVIEAAERSGRTGKTLAVTI